MSFRAVPEVPPPPACLVEASMTGRGDSWQETPSDPGERREREREEEREGKKGGREGE